MAKNYPRRQTFLIFLICAIIVAGFAVYVHVSKIALENKVSYADATTATVGDTASIVAANSDWQKQFFSEGTSKPIELKSGEKKLAASTKPKTLTDEISQDLFTQFWQIHKAGLQSDDKVLSSFSDRFASQVAAAAAPNLYTVNDIRIAATANPSAVSAYAKQVTNLLKSVPISDAAIIANNALQENGKSSLAEIDPIIKSYRSILTSLKAMSVPPSLASQHLNLINAVSTILFNAEALRRADVDPVRGLAALSIYVQGLQMFSDSLADLENGLKVSGIVFSGSSNIQ